MRPAIELLAPPCEGIPDAAPFTPFTPTPSSATPSTNSTPRTSSASRHGVDTSLTHPLLDTIVRATSSLPRPSPKPKQILPSHQQQPSTPTITRLLYSCLSWFTGRMPKIPLEKGCSQMDWLRLAQSSKNLNGLAGSPLRTDITMQEVRLHKTKEDAWMVFNGMVYNITPYLKFHPGGSEILLKAAGKDGTSLFMKYHAWVNIGALMSKCLVGRLALSPIQAQAAAEVQQARLERQQQQQQQQQQQLATQDASPPQQAAGTSQALVAVAGQAGAQHSASAHAAEPSQQSQGPAAARGSAPDAGLGSTVPEVRNLEPAQAGIKPASPGMIQDQLSKEDWLQTHSPDCCASSAAVQVSL